MYKARIIADSLAPCGKRLTTMEITFPRIVLAEFNTHRQFSRNSASSRAIPVEKMIKRVLEDPFIPARFPLNEKGMQASAFAEPGDELYEKMERQWQFGAESAVGTARTMIGLGVHKQIANRLLEPFLWHTVIVTATEWTNFFAQRCHPDAQPEIRTVADMMKLLYDTSEPEATPSGGWHLPYVYDIEEENQLSTMEKVKLSVARCARVSYLNHDGRRDACQDLALYDRLRTGMHMSPLEHAAWASCDADRRSGNFVGWVQHRKEIPDECR